METLYHVALFSLSGSFIDSLLAASLTVTALSPAYAAQDLCNDAHMKQMDKTIAEMTDATNKDEATAALDKSKAAMDAAS